VWSALIPPDRLSRLTPPPPKTRIPRLVRTETTALNGSTPRSGRTTRCQPSTSKRPPLGTSVELAGPSRNGRGWFRTSDLSRVKRVPTARDGDQQQAVTSPSGEIVAGACRWIGSIRRSNVRPAFDRRHGPRWSVNTPRRGG